MGHLITNYHVLKGSYRAEVKTGSGEIYPIKGVVAENEETDLVKVSVGIPKRSLECLPHHCVEALRKSLPDGGRHPQEYLKF